MNRLISCLIILTVFAACSESNETQEKSKDQKPVIEKAQNIQSRSVLRRDYFSPTRIVWQSDNTETFIINSKKLLEKGNGQADLVGKNICTMKGGDSTNTFILFDFGIEIQGGLQIVTSWSSDKAIKVKLTFGESVSEAMSEVEKSSATNDHAIREFEVTLPWLGSVEVGNTGYRFVKMEMLDNKATLKLKEVNAISIYRDIPYLGSFKSNDERLNQIWQTGAYTVHLNMQDYLWDGIKRDRLVWVGDLHPEIMTINAVFGYNEVVPKSLDLIRDITAADEWMNSISSYSMWWILIHKEWYMNHGNLDYLKEQKTYLVELLNKLASYVDKNGKESLDGTRFIDWPSKADTAAVSAGYHAMLIITFEAGEELCTLLGDKETADLCRAKANLMRKLSPDPANSKQAAALLVLAGSISDEVGNEVLEKDGAERFSTFYGYYMLQAMAKAGNHEGALNIIRDYWGGMLDLAATTFWEDFDINWLKNAGRIDEMPGKETVDVHSEYGGYCYVGFRHSFCHGWASGPTAWLSEHVLGVKILAPGCSKISIKPNLGDLKWVEGTYPSPKGLIKLRHEKLESGEIKSEIELPDGIELTK